MSRSLMQVVVDVVAFLDQSGDEILDEDAAVAQLEHIAEILRAMPPDELRDFGRFVDEAAREAAAVGDVARAAFLRAVPTMLGLAEDRR